MAGLQHADWITHPDTDPAGKLAKLNLYIVELQERIGPNISADGKSRDHTNYVEMLRIAMDERKQLLTKVEQTPVHSWARIP